MAKQAKPQPVNDLFLALFSLLLAFVVWVIVRQQEVLTQTILVPIQPEKLPPFIELDPEKPFEPTQIAVSFSFPKGDERMAGSGDFHLRVDLDTLAERVSSTENFTRHTVRLSREMIEAPSKLTFVEFRSEPEVELRARMRVAEALVVPNIVAAEPAEGYRIDKENILVEPSRIDVAVDETRARIAEEGQLLEVTTEPVDLTGEQDFVRRVVGILLEPASGIYPLPDEPVPTIEVFIPIPEIELTREFENIPIRYAPFTKGVQASLAPETATVTVDGPRSVVEGLEPSMIRLRPYLSDFVISETIGESSETLITHSFELPEELQNKAEDLTATVEPLRVRVRFSASETPAAPTPEVAPTPAPSLTPVPTPEAAAIPEPVPTAVPTPTPQPTPEPTPSPSPAPEETQSEDGSTTGTADSTTPLDPTPVPVPDPKEES